MAFTPDYTIISGQRARRFLLDPAHRWYPARYVEAPLDFVRMKNGDAEFLMPLDDAHEGYAAAMETAIAVIAETRGDTVEHVYTELAAL